MGIINTVENDNLNIYQTRASWESDTYENYNPWQYENEFQNEDKKKGNSLNDYANKVRERVDEKLKNGKTSTESYIPDVDGSRTGLEHSRDEPPESSDFDSKWLILGGIVALILWLK